MITWIFCCISTKNKLEILMTCRKISYRFGSARKTYQKKKNSGTVFHKMVQLSGDTSKSEQTENFEGRKYTPHTLKKMI